MTHPTVTHINANADAIIRGIPEEAVAVYSHLRKEFEKGDVTRNPVFQFLYRSYYRMDNAGLTQDFKSAYFQLMEEVRGEKIQDIDRLVIRLSEYPLSKQLKARESGKDEGAPVGSVQFSFVTKMLNTIDHEYPIYDAAVARMFDFTYPYHDDFDRKLLTYREYYKTIWKTYASVLASGQLDDVVSKFQDRFGQYGVPVKRVIDFVYRTAGKTISK